MDNIQREYGEAYFKANGKKIRVRRIITVRYMLPGSNSEFTEKQIRGFTKGLQERVNEAVNACQAINPDNPLVVAQNIKGMVEALQKIASCQVIHPGDVVDTARLALAKALAKESES